MMLCIVIGRFFCKVLCPLGAVYSLFNRFSFMQYHHHDEHCDHCGKCQSKCIMELKPADDLNSPRMHPLRRMQSSMPQ
ncbi:MAG: 4Fe-4S binding protein [Clostridia bacterium]|nr:4Fe-4S binding protein [Clostridia bacterium]